MKIRFRIVLISVLSAAGLLWIIHTPVSAPADSGKLSALQTAVFATASVLELFTVPMHSLGRFVPARSFWLALVMINPQWTGISAAISSAAAMFRPAESYPHSKSASPAEGTSSQNAWDLTNSERKWIDSSLYAASCTASAAAFLLVMRLTGLTGLMQMWTAAGSAAIAFTLAEYAFPQIAFPEYCRSLDCEARHNFLNLSILSLGSSAAGLMTGGSCSSGSLFLLPAGLMLSAAMYEAARSMAQHEEFMRSRRLSRSLEASKRKFRKESEKCGTLHTMLTEKVEELTGLSTLAECLYSDTKPDFKTFTYLTANLLKADSAVLLTYEAGKLIPCFWHSPGISFWDRWELLGLQDPLVSKAWTLRRELMSQHRSQDEAAEPSLLTGLKWQAAIPAGNSGLLWLARASEFFSDHEVLILRAAAAQAGYALNLWNNTKKQTESIKQLRSLLDESDKKCKSLQYLTEAAPKMWNSPTGKSLLHITENLLKLAAGAEIAGFISTSRPNIPLIPPDLIHSAIHNGRPLLIEDLRNTRFYNSRENPLRSILAVPFQKMYRHTQNSSEAPSLEAAVIASSKPAAFSRTDQEMLQTACLWLQQLFSRRSQASPGR